MKEFLKQTMKTDQIENVNLEKLKEAIEGKSMLTRLKYRKSVGNFMQGKKKIMAKGEVFKQEHAQAEFIDDKLKHPMFGFKCLHYSVSEASGSLKVMILNKTANPCEVRVATIDAEAKSGDDYEGIDKILQFKKGETS